MYKYDTDVEYSMITKYSNWIVGKQSQVVDAKDERQAEFYGGLSEDVEEELRKTEGQNNAAMGEVENWIKRHGEVVGECWHLKPRSKNQHSKTT